MKKILITSILLVTIIASVLLVLNSRSDQGILNDLAQKNVIEAEKEPGKTEVTEKEKAEHIENEQELKENQLDEAKEIEESYTIVIDPGHQAEANHEQEPIGPGATETKPKVASGTAGVVTEIPEYILTLQASLLLEQHLKQKGFDITLTRLTHDVDISNSERAAIANELDADLFLRIHADGVESAEAKGFSLLVPGNENKFTQDIYEDSQAAANAILAKVENDINLLGNGIFIRDDLSGFNWSDVPVVLVELGFMTNPEEDQLLADETYIKKLTGLIAEGVEDYVRKNE